MLLEKWKKKKKFGIRLQFRFLPIFVMKILEIEIIVRVILCEISVF